MRKFQTWVKQLSLSQQLFALIFFFVTFFCVFFFVYLNGNINKVIESQMFSTIDRTQKEIITRLKDEQLGVNDLDRLIQDPYLSHMIIVQTDKQINSIIDRSDRKLQSDTGLSKDIINRVKEMKGDSQEFSYHGDSVTTYYKAVKVFSSKEQSLTLVTAIDSAYMESFRTTLVSSVINVTVVVVGLFFIILMVWMATMIHPLNQIRNYIEKIKTGEDAELKITRRDEIGELADALMSMRQELKRQEKTKEEMIHNISHDLKTPIATIKSYGESIKDGIYPYDTLEKSVDVIIDNADRLEKKVHSLLFLNRVEYLISQDNNGAITDMHQVIETVVLATKAIRSDIDIITEIDDDIFFDGLEESWRVTVENILENALRYAKTNITIRLHESELTISNDGPSMSDDRLKVLFKPYEKGQGGQFGLGLSIVAKVVHANGFEVAGENTSDGVIFRIYKK